MKLVFVTTGLDPGGAEAMLLKLVERLGRRFSTTVISLGDMGNVGPRIQATGVTVKTLGMRPGRFNIRKAWDLTTLLRKLGPDVVQTWMYHANLIGGFAAKAAGIPAVAWGVRLGNPFSAATKPSTLAVVKATGFLSRWLACRIVYCSAAARALHERVGYASGAGLVIPNGFDLTGFRPDPSARQAIREEIGVGADVPLVGLIARYHPQKDHAGFIKAAALVRATHPAVHFVLTGSGVDHANTQLARDIENAGLADVTHLLGLRSDVPAVMAALDILASSSIDEGFPNVIGEAMACEVPCVVTDVGDSAYIVGDTGVAVPSQNPAALAAALSDMLAKRSSELAELGRKGRLRIEQNFDIRDVVQRYEALYDELAANNKRACAA